MRKETRKLLRAAEREGAQVRMSRSGHIRVTYQGKTVTMSSSPSDFRAHRQQRRDLKRLGVTV